MPAAMKRHPGFAGRPLALRRRVIEVLSRRDRLTAFDIAAAAFTRGRLMVFPGHGVNVTASQITSVRHALRRLVERGRVQEVGRYRHRKMFGLTEKRP